MAAVVDIREWNGTSGSETATSKTSGTIRFKSADNANFDLNDPIVRPGSGIERSYEKFLRLRIGDPGPTSGITYPRAFSDGAKPIPAWDGIEMYAGGIGAYATPANTDSGVAATDFFSYTSGSPLDLGVFNTGSYSGTNTDIADYLVMQADVIPAAAPGLTVTETLTIAYDET